MRKDERERERQKFTHWTLMSARIFTSWFWTWAQLYKEGTGKLKECSQDRERERNIHSLLTDFVISYVNIYYAIYIFKFHKIYIHLFLSLSLSLFLRERENVFMSKNLTKYKFISLSLSLSLTFFLTLSLFLRILSYHM